jgi:hypothetical protein
MPRPLRFVPENSLVEVTTRTLQGRLLLKPSPELTDIILGIIGKAQVLYGMTIHAFITFRLGSRDGIAGWDRGVGSRDRIAGRLRRACHDCVGSEFGSLRFCLLCRWHEN